MKSCARWDWLDRYRGWTSGGDLIIIHTLFERSCAAAERETGKSEVSPEGARCHSSIDGSASYAEEYRVIHHQITYLAKDVFASSGKRLRHGYLSPNDS